MRFTRAIVRKPGPELVKGISSKNFGLPDYNEAVKQHDEYIKVLENCGLEVFVLNSDPDFPDGVFVEDTAVLTENCAIIDRPAPDSRMGEEVEINKVLGRFYKNIKYITAPGTLEGGDVMRAGNHFFIGLSERTNPRGADQFIKILKEYGYTGSVIKMREMLHLKTGVAYLGSNILLTTGELISYSGFNKFNKVIISEDEADAANSIMINGKVIMPAGFSKSYEKIRKMGLKVILVNVSEFRKLDGGLSCMSLRF